MTTTPIDPYPGTLVRTLKTRLGWIALREARGKLVRSVLPVPTRERALELLGAPTDRADDHTPLLNRAADHLATYVDRDPAVPTPVDLLALTGTGFSARVYDALVRVPAGTVLTYGELAARAGSPAASRAVGRAMASNRLAPLVPCHRVVRSDGSLGGYSADGGTALKRALLEWEGMVFDGEGCVIRDR